MYDPFPSEICGGQWQSVRGDKQLVYLGHDRILEFEPATGIWRQFIYDANCPNGDPLSVDPFSQGQWGSIRDGHELVYLGDDHVLDWTPYDGSYRVWVFNRESTGDPFFDDPVQQGQWSSIRGSRKLIPIGESRVLEWEPSSGFYRVWEHDRNAADPFPGQPLAQGEWNTIRDGHVLAYLGHDRVLDWNQWTGEYRLYAVARVPGVDPLPSPPLTHGQWQTIVGDRRMIPLRHDQVLDWEPSTGAFHVWAVQH